MLREKPKERTSRGRAYQSEANGTDWLVVVMKPGNAAGGAKGSGCPAFRMGPPNRGGTRI